MGQVLLVQYNQPSLAEAWNHHFQFENDVEILQGNIFDFEWDAIVSPGNSFGFMDGGLDLQISNKFGWGIQTELRKRIAKKDNRELLIGQSETIHVKQADKYIICAPTMRVPDKKMIPQSVNAYLSMKAVLSAYLKNKNIGTVAIPGLCTGTGGMAPEIAAKQMFTAYKEVIKEEHLEFQSYLDAKKHHNGLNPLA